MNTADTVTGELSSMDLRDSTARVLATTRLDGAPANGPMPSLDATRAAPVEPPHQFAGPLEVSVFTLPFSLPRRRWQRIPANLAMLVPAGLP